MAKDPAVLWYTSDFLTGTAHFKDDELGLYTRLLAYQHQQGRLSMDFIQRSCKGNFDRKWSIVKEKFLVDAAGMYYNERMENEILRRQKSSIKQADRVEKRWEKYRQEKYRGNTESIQDTGNTFLETVNETETVKGKEGAGEKGRWNSKPSDQEMILEPMEVQMTVEFIHRLKKLLLTEQQVNDMWAAFKIQNFTGAKYYQTRADCLQHFRNWLKGQKDYGTHQQSTDSSGKPGTSAARIQTAREW